jgi:hypothetical protein
MKCQRCGEREAEVHHTNIVRTEGRGEAQTEQLCTVCANFDASDLRGSLLGLLRLMPDMAPEHRRHIEGMIEKLEDGSTDPGPDDTKAD